MAGRHGADILRTVRRRYELRHAELDAALDDLVRRAGEVYGGHEAEYLRQLLVSAVGLIRDGVSTADLKLVNTALKELRHSFRVFAPFKHLRKVAVFGSARTLPGHADWEQARTFADRIVARGWMVITGAGEGIMAAAQAGAGPEASFGVNIRLPFEQRANAVIARDPKLINFRYFFTRKVTFVKEAHAIALFPGGFGTHDEAFEALTLIQTGKSEILPLVFVDTPGGTYWKEWAEFVDSHLRTRGLIDTQDRALFKITDDPEAAVTEIVDFYRNYHSSRYVGELLVLRVLRAPDPEQIEALNDEFGDILRHGRIRVSAALDEERGEVDGYPRVVVPFDRRSVGRLRQLIDRLNGWGEELPLTPPEASPHEIVEEPLPESHASADESL